MTQAFEELKIILTGSIWPRRVGFAARKAIEVK